MKRPWSLFIWRTLIETQRAPAYARRYRRDQNRQPAPLPRATARHALNCTSVAGLLLMATPCGWIACFALVSLASADSPLLALALAGGCASTGGIGAAILASRIALALQRLKRHQVLDYWLMLPHPRRDLVLYGVAPAYEPAVFHLSLVIAEFSALLLASASLAAMPRLTVLALLGWWALAALLLVEGMQWIALSVIAGIAAGTTARLGVPAALLYGLLVVMARGAGGLLIALLLGMPGGWFPLVIITGPLSGAVAAPHTLIGIAAGVLYLIALEGMVQWAFGRALYQIGEG